MLNQQDKTRVIPNATEPKLERVGINQSNIDNTLLCHNSTQSHPHSISLGKAFQNVLPNVRVHTRIIIIVVVVGLIGSCLRIMVESTELE
jgi:hypothetical protein